jgi:hypothetical protein
VNPQSTDLHQIVAAIQALQQTLERVVRLSEEHARRELEQLAANATPPEEEPPPIEEPQAKPIDWFHVSGRDRLNAWRDLSAFVERLVIRYNMEAVVRPCWWQHPEAVEELTALLHLRQYSYQDGASLAGAMSWLDNFNKSRERLRAMFMACTTYHVAPIPRPWMSEADRAAFYEGVRQELL